VEATQGNQPLRIYTLGRFSLVRDGEPVRFSARTRKPIELLKALLAAGGREVSTAQMIDLLWPEADGDTAHNSLNVTLYRLRKLLGIHDAILLLDNKLALNPKRCWVDAWEFERQINSIEPLLKTPDPDPAKIRGDTGILLGLCKGSFLKGEACPKASASRERLQGKCLRVLESIGQFWEEQGDWAHAREFYLKGLELEPMLESFYQRLMVCHRELGQRAEAMMVYQRCHNALSAHLNLTPSRHTEAIRGTLVAE